MKNTSAVQVESSPKEEARGKTYRIPISNGIFEHYPKLKDAMWLLLLYVDWTTKEVRAADGSFDGSVLGGKPVSDADVARAFPVRGGPSERSIWRWRNHLARCGYITQKRTGSGYIITVKKSKKWPKSDPQKVQTGSEESSDHSSRELTKVQIRTDKSSDQIRQKFGSRSDSTGTRQGLCKEAEAPQSGATPPTAANQSTVPVKACWEILGLTMPIGGVAFQGEWEAFYDGHRQNYDVVDVMEQFIQLKLNRGQKGIPPRFYDLKHEMEAEEKQLEAEVKQLEAEVVEAQRWVETQKELEAQAKAFLPASSSQVILMAPLPAETPALPARAELSREAKERQVLRMVLRDNGVLETDGRIKNLDPNDFQYERHWVIFAGMLRMRRDGMAITVEYLAAWLQGRGELDRAGGEGYVRALVDVDVAPARKATA